MENLGASLGVIIFLVIATTVNGLILWAVGRMKIGIEIEKFGTAFLAAFLSALFGWFLAEYTSSWFGSANAQWRTVLLHIAGSALILLIVGALLPGMRTKGFTGAVIAAVAIAFISWMVGKLF